MPWVRVWFMTYSQIEYMYFVVRSVLLSNSLDTESSRKSETDTKLSKI